MGKKKSNVKHATQSFSELVSDAQIDKLKPFIANEVNKIGKLIAQQQLETIGQLYTRLVVLEKLAVEKLDVTEDEIASRVCDIEDEKSGLVQVDEAKAGDVMRLTIATKTKDQKEFQGESRVVVEQLGLGKSLGQELEMQLVGLKVNEEKELEFGQDKSLLAKVTVNRISRNKGVVGNENNNEG